MQRQAEVRIVQKFGEQTLTYSTRFGPAQFFQMALKAFKLGKESRVREIADPASPPSADPRQPPGDYRYHEWP